jgi:hypothetical protein
LHRYYLRLGIRRDEHPGRAQQLVAQPIAFLFDPQDR